MSHHRIDQDTSRTQDETAPTPQTRAPLISRPIDPSNVVFSLVFCQQTRREFDVQQAS